MSISLSCCNYPPADSIPIIWRENLGPLMELVQNLASGIRATVMNERGAPLRGASVKLGKRSYGVSRNMAYFKMILVPGEYTLTVSCEGYDMQTLKVSVRQQSVTDINIRMIQKNATQLDTADRNQVPEKLSFVNRVLSDLNIKYPRQTTLHTIGRTAKGSEIMCLEIGSENDRIERSSIIFSAGVLRADPVTSGVLLHLASYLLDNSKKNATIARYIDDFSIYIAPDFSPDFNANLTCASPPSDGSRQFPIHDKLDNEAATIANWFRNINAVLAVNLNSGSRHIEIPFGREYGTMDEQRYKSADEDLLQHLASLYADARTDKLSESSKCERDSNIGDNSVIHAGMGIGRSHPLMDYIYFNTNTVMMDVYITCCTTDHSSAVWEQNKASLLACIQELNKDVRGYVTNEDDEPIVDVVLSYDKSPHVIKNGKSGFYSILLPPGNHNVTATAPGYHEETKLFSMHSFETRKYSRLMFKLIRDDNIIGIPRLVFIMITGKYQNYEIFTERE